MDIRKPSRKLGICLAWSICVVCGCSSTPKAPSPALPTSASAGPNTTIVAIAPAPAAKQCSLPEFLGLPAIGQAVGGVFQRLGSRLLNGLDLTGRFPELQPQPPVLPLTDPANLEEGAPPAVQAAAEIKQEEDAAPQKIMAIRYLATIGCGGCYPKVEDALLEAMSDCTEEVRFEAVKALQCKPECGCKYCSSPSCCSEKVRKRLEELTTCEKEPSERIRRLAAIALACCNSKPLIEEDQVPREGPPPPAASEPVSWYPQQTSSFFDGIQLVSFHESVTPQPGDMVLAMVNGEAIYESQAMPLVEARLRNKEGLNANDAALRRSQLVSELMRLIDWKLIHQQSRHEVRLANDNADFATASPIEAQKWFERNLYYEKLISSQELLAYYEVNKERFRLPSRVRWERITVKAEKCSSRQAAFEIAAYLRSRALGVTVNPPAEFSKEKIESQIGGWTELASIPSETERLALKQLRPGGISNPVETRDGWFLVRLLERSDDGYQPVALVADRIRYEILAERKRAAELRLIGTLRSQSQIWTVFDSPGQTNTTHEPVSSVNPASAIRK